MSIPTHESFFLVFYPYTCTSEEAEIKPQLKKNRIDVSDDSLHLDGVSERASSLIQYLQIVKIITVNF